MNLFYNLFTFNDSRGLTQPLMLAFGLEILSVTPKFIAFIVLFSEDVFRVVKSTLNFFFKNSEPDLFPNRRAFVSKMALGLAAIPFGSVLYGMIRGKYNYQILNHTLYFDDLPEAFNGFKLTHISDIHSGSFDDEDKIAYGIDLINEQESDVILFTGDIVNNTADEMDDWIPYFKKLKAKEGKYSVLGNHDYGEYTRWKTIEEKAQNFQAIKDIHPKIGFNLMLNESVYIEKETDKIALIGVENWGTRFKKAGDLKKATDKINKKDFKILTGFQKSPKTSKSPRMFRNLSKLSKDFRFFKNPSRPLRIFQDCENL